MKYFSKIQIFAFFIIASVMGLSPQFGVDNNYAGHPLDLGTCANCHDGGPGVGNIALTGVPLGFVPGQIYPITLTLNDNYASDAGFQIVAVSGTASNTQVGTFINFPSNTRLTSSGRLTHDTKAQLSAAGSVSWNFSWRAPSSSAPSNVYFYYAVNAVDGNNEITGDKVRTGVSSAIPLPIALISFEVERKESYLQFDWTTQTEINADRFEIESSNDGKNFSIIDIKTANGDSDEIQQYSTKIFSHLEDTYFRLKMIDFDGTFTYSNIVFSKQLLKDLNVKISTGEVAVSFPDDIQANVIVYDLTGRVIVQESLQNTSDWSSSTLFYPKGIYIVQVTGDHLHNFTQKFVVQ